MSIMSSNDNIVKIMDNAGNVIVDMRRKEIIGELPLVFESDGKNLFDYKIYGNTGGVGDRCNLFNKDNADITTAFPHPSTGELKIEQSYGDSPKSVIIAVEPNTAYTIQIDKLSNIYVRAAEYSSYPQVGDAGTLLSTTATLESNTSYGASFTTSATAAYIVWYFSWNATESQLQTKLNSMMLSKGTEIKNYQPYNKCLIPVKVEGKNLFDKNIATPVPYFSLDSDGSWSPKTTYYSVIIPCEPNTTYKVTKMQTNRFRLSTYERLPVTGDAAIAFYKGADSDTTGIINSGANAHYLAILLYYNENNQYSSIKDEILDSIEVVEGTSSLYSNTVYLYVDAPLTVSQSVRLADTNINIPTTTGLNTLTVGTTIQPRNVMVKGNLEFVSSGDKVTYKVYYYNDDGSQLVFTETVNADDDALGSVVVPTKTSTAQYTYTFIGWSTTPNNSTVDTNALINITSDKNLYAVFRADTKTY